MTRGILVAAFIVLAAGLVRAEDVKLGALEIRDAWSRATPHGAQVAAGYLTLVNTGREGDRLVSGSSPAADKVEIHTMSMEGGVMRMRPLPAGLEVKPGTTVELKPNGLHLMFMGLKEGLVPGQRIKATLVFEKAGATQVEFTVRAMGGSSNPAGTRH